MDEVRNVVPDKGNFKGHSRRRLGCRTERR
jgi:hypothetical protein